MIAGSSQAAECYVERFAEFTFADESVDLGCAAPALAEQLRAPNSTIKSFLVDFVTSDAFRYRSIQEAP